MSMMDKITNSLGKLNVKYDEKGPFVEIDDVVNGIRNAKTDEETKMRMRLWFMGIVHLGRTVGNARFVMNDPINREYYAQIIHPFILKCDETIADKMMNKPE